LTGAGRLLGALSKLTCTPHLSSTGLERIIFQPVGQFPRHVLTAPRLRASAGHLAEKVTLNREISSTYKLGGCYACPPMNPSFQPDPETLQAAKPVPAKSSAVKAGWICLILGFLTFWIFGLGFVFFVATFILAIVAMSTNRLGQGIALLVSSVGSSILCVIISLALLSSAFTAALKKERARRNEQPTPRMQLHRVALAKLCCNSYSDPRRVRLLSISTQPQPKSWNRYPALDHHAPNR